MGNILPPKHDLCMICRHYTGTAIIETEKGLEGDMVHVCKAFPNGIPDEISMGDKGHKNPVNGDNGIQFEPLENP
jgi:hypothetical protein